MCYLRITVKKKAILIVTAYMAILQFAPPSNYQSETIAFIQNKNAPPDYPEGALYQNWSL